MRFIPMSRVQEILANCPSKVSFNGVKAKVALTQFRTMSNAQRANVAKVVSKAAHYAEQARK
jgi:hypothetical protein